MDFFLCTRQNSATHVVNVYRTGNKSRRIYLYEIAVENFITSTHFLSHKSYGRILYDYNHGTRGQDV